ncbi:hypothetical protein INT43_004252 [Umbelopsis isabellina]|uniref:Trichome birefringence-like C-terminal domain-containing protein n=1 Tax=Mortierella isabellina TaxID=91625 RepID=A0A8H7U7J2_MORIS|nr:hypothetical protein INT43_004252 [Umbelopsis isabellina]
MDQRQVRTSRRSAIRFVLYALIILFVYRLIASFASDDKAAPSEDVPTPKDPAPHLGDNVKGAQEQKPKAPPITNEKPEVDLPWYPKVSKLTTAERIELEQQAISKARAIAQDAMSHYNIQGIPGSAIKTAQEAKEFYQKAQCFTQGSWVYAPHERPLLKHLQEALYSKCDKRYAKGEMLTDKSDWKVRPDLKYIWSPLDKTQCPLRPIDKSKWCKMLHGRHILLVGDIVQFQMHELILDTFRDGPVVCYGELNCKDHTLCSGPETRLRYLRNDLLSVVRKNPETTEGKPHMRVVQWPWITSNIVDKFPVLILNRGGSYVPDDEFRDQLIETMKNIRNVKLDHLIIYRSTPIGHPDCDSATGPLASRPTESELQDLPYRWGDFKRQNMIAKEIVEAAGGVFVDIAQMADLRPDGHIGGHDCMRYCIPGPADAWVDVLYNMFLLLE